MSCHLQALSYDLNASGPKFSINLLPLDCNMTGVTTQLKCEFGHTHTKQIFNVVSVDEFEYIV